MKDIALRFFLGLSILFSLVLLLTDAELWAVAPEHAYTLILLTTVDFFLLAFLFRKNRLGIRLATYWGVAKSLLLLGDILTAPQYGLTYAEFAAYLFSLWAFVGLLLSQVGVAASGLALLRMKRNKSRKPTNL
ncbi:MAG: hypothetical protein QW059_00125 [Nitrososphaerota archaeon]